MILVLLHKTNFIISSIPSNIIIINKSSGNLFPKLALNFFRIWAIENEGICLTFGIEIPENPMLINSVKKSAILCLGYSFSVLTSTKLAK